MVLRKGFPSKLSGSAADADDVRYDLAGTVVRDSTGLPRSGLFAPVSATLLTATASWNVAVGIFNGAAVRDGGPIFLANDGAANALTSGAPASNQRLDVVYAKQNDSSATVSVPDANNLPIFGVLAGVPSATPVRNPAGLPAGALELGTIQIPSTATATNSPGVIISPTWQYTTMAGGVLPTMTKAKLDAITTMPDGTLAMVSDGTYNGAYVASGGVWLRATGKPESTPFAMACGETNGNATGGSSAPLYWGGNLTVTFPAGRFSRAPGVQATVDTNGIAFATVNSITTTGCTIVITRVGSTPGFTEIAKWTAVQMFPTTATG